MLKKKHNEIIDFLEYGVIPSHVQSKSNYRAYCNKFKITNNILTRNGKPVVLKSELKQLW